MKYSGLIIIFSSLLIYSAYSQADYSTCFTDERMRMDLVFAGNDRDINVYFEKVKKEPLWGGTRINLVDPLDRGQFQFRILDRNSKKLLFSRCFSTLYEEWQTTTEAENIERSLTASVVFPFPKQEIIFELYQRDKENKFDKIFEIPVSPQDIFIESGLKYNFPVIEVLKNGDPADHIDIVFLAEGYLADQMDLFLEDVNRFYNYLFTVDPFMSNIGKFNIWAVQSVSADEGPDIPGDGIWKNTILNTNFYTFNSERYLMTYDFRTVCDVAANVPYDQIFILVNSEKYGGGGVYNNYCVCSSRGRSSEVVMVHEFGHGFAGLGDEYYSSSVAYEEFFDLSVEPWEPNLTTLVDFDAKWADLVDSETPVPTPPEEKYKTTTGVFEGGGYMAKGVYRPALDCRMKSNEADGFCEACKRAVIQMIQYYTE